nr:hypothetical protein CFP56_18814 [Quercus suber]
MRTQGNLKLCCKVLADAWSHWGKTSNLVRSCIPSKRDENTGQSLILNAWSHWGKTSNLVSLGQLDSHNHLSTKIEENPSNLLPSPTSSLQMESGSCLIMQLPIRSRYLKCFKLPMELGNTSKDELLRSSTRKYLNLAIHTSNDKLLHQG